MFNNIFDSHAHYNDDRFLENQDEVISHVLNNGVKAVINVGYDIEASVHSIELSDKYETFFAAVGIHPHNAKDATENYIEDLRKLASHKKVVAIGEIGLDYHYNLSEVAVQKQVFEECLILANELDLPVIIHSREATADTLELLEKYKPKGVVHCFSGSAETAKKIVALGMYIGYTGVVTFKNANKIKNSVANTPIERLLLETDCPYMAPEPNRGKLCTSDMIGFTAKAVAEIKAMDTQELIDRTTENCCELFKITL